MASNILSQNTISSGRKNILQSLPNPTPYTSATTYTRPSDWTLLPTVTDTYYATGIYAVYNTENNFVAFTTTITAGPTALGTIAGTNFSISAPTTPYLVGQAVTGAGVTAGTTVTSVKSLTYNWVSSVSSVTISAFSGDPIYVGMSINLNGTWRVISAFGTGTGGNGTYTFAGANYNASGTASTTTYATVNNSQTVGTAAAPVSLTSNNGITVDWGDGTTDTYYTASATPQHNYVYANVPGVVCSRGYKTAAIKITCITTTTTPLTAINFPVKYVATSLQGTINAYTSRWLDMRINTNSLTGITLGGSAAPLNMLEQVQIDTGLSTNNNKNFSTLFSGLKSFQNLIVGSSLVITDLSSAFIGTSILSAPSFTNTNTGSCTNASTMFQSCTLLTYCPNYYLPACTNMGTMFNNCNSLEVSPSFTTSASLLTVTSMFSACPNLRQVGLFNTSGVTDFSSMFVGCQSLTVNSLPIFNTISGLNFTNMFQNCYNLTTIPLLNTSNGTNFTTMFSGCQSLTSIPLLNTSNATTLSGMFVGCTTLPTIPLLNTSKVTSIANTFQTTTNLVTIPTIDTSNVTDMSYTFNASGIKTLPTINTIKVSNMYSTFATTPRLLNVPTLNTSNVTLMYRTFYQSAITEIPAWNTNNVSNMSAMFQFANNFVTTNVFPLNTSNVTDMSYMFNTANSIITAPTFNDTSKVANVMLMFSGASKLQNIPSYNLPNCTNFYSMVSGSNISSFNGSNIGVQSTSNLNAIFNSCTNLVTIANINVGNVGVVANTLTFSSTPSLSSFSNVTNCKFTMTIAGCNFGKSDIENIFANTIVYPGATAQVITITGNPGADTSNSKTSGITAGSNVITMANTVGVIAGSTFISGTGINTGIPVSFTISSSTVAYTNGSVNPLQNGDNVMFTSITSTFGISTNTTYFVVNSTGTNFQVAATSGGTAITLTTANGTGVMSIGGATVANKVVTVNSNANVIINGVAGITNAAASLTARNLNTNYATTKNWTVTG